MPRRGRSDRPVARPPHEDRRRGVHLALRHHRAEPLCQRLHKRGAIGDYRQADPLCFRFEAIQRLEAIVNRIE
jgi:kynureninase